MKKILTAALTLLLLLVFALPVAGSSTPGGPFLPGKANHNTEGFMSNEQLEKALNQIEANSKGTMELDVIGHSGTGTEIFMAKVGDGPESIMIQNQQHGNEPHGAEAAINILRFLTSERQEAKELREQITVYMLPRVNPDGSELGIRTNGDWRAPNHFASHGFFTSSVPGWDINRYHWFDWEDSTLFQYNHAGIYSEEFGLINGRSLTGTPREYDGVEGYLVDVGFGTSEEYTDAIKEKVEGNIALVSRGENSFTDKAANAYEAGALGVVAYNDEPELSSFAISSDIPVMYTFQKFGQQLVDSLEDGEDIYVEFQNSYPENPVPEAQAVVDAYKKYEPKLMLDLHNQFSYVDEDERAVTSSILWPTNPDVPDDALEMSKQMAVVIMDHMEQYGYANVNKFPGGDAPEIARNAYGLAGSGNLLIEIRGQTQSEVGQTSNGMLTRHAQEQVMSVIRAAADGSLYEADATRADTDLPTVRDRYRKDLPSEEEAEEAAPREYEEEEEVE
ncbi:hypothetical protein K8O68_04880 [Salipaludibacillus sp. CUR1]|uniref:M14 family zinc carboxypeptidase n=1 Tax=Salipaludibacillus sp. CUR1 TaxID=2820003 RepID=UPI001E30BE36|nr:M14 family zinc carboxypeptidase [Salipaludibacillus sp. CUR1]MCE7791764.1 hypothetical protein [Salipaludibacillus sp. CUR1]